MKQQAPDTEKLSELGRHCSTLSMAHIPGTRTTLTLLYRGVKRTGKLPVAMFLVSGRAGI